MPNICLTVFDDLPLQKTANLLINHGEIVRFAVLASSLFCLFAASGPRRFGPRRFVPNP